MGELAKRIAKGKTIVDNDKTKQDKILSESIQELSTTEAGVVLLTYLRKFCGFGEPNSLKNIQTGELSLYSTAYNTAQENVYKNLRRYMSKKTKIRVELND